MRHIKYYRLEDEIIEENQSQYEHQEDSPTFNKIGLVILFLIWFSVFFVVYFSDSLRVQSRGNCTYIPRFQQSKNNALERNISNFQDNYFSTGESQFLNCPDLIKGNQDAIDTYVNYGRMKLNREKLLDLPMDCFSLRNRLLGDLPDFKPLNKSIAFVRNVYGSYELQEVFLSMTYHPNHFYCYAIDSKNSEKLSRMMMDMASCFDNVFVLHKKYDMDRAGHNQDRAHFDCLELLLDRNWSHAITLQNFDMIIKTPEQLSDLSETLNSSSIMGSDYGFQDRYDFFADWTPAGMKLFKDEKNVLKDILHRPLAIRKSLNQVILAKQFVKSLFEKLNLDKIIERFDNKSMFGVDEMMVMTIYENYLGLEGQMESNCTEELEDELTRLTYWHLEQSNGYYPDCKSKWLRHSICVFGVEYLKEFTESPIVIANKVTEDFDFGAIICTREMIKNKQTGKNPDAKWLSTKFPQFKEMQMKSNGTYNRNSFKC